MFIGDGSVGGSTFCVCGDMQTVAEFGSNNAFVPHVNRRTGDPCLGMPQLARCVHCRRKCGDFEGGYASVGHAPLCHPNAEARPDCYHMVTVYHHDLLDCSRCKQDPYQPLTPAELHDAMIDGLHRLEQIVRDAMP